MMEFYDYAAHLLFGVIASLLILKGYGSGWLMNIQEPYLKYVNRWLVGLGNWMECVFGNGKGERNAK